MDNALPPPFSRRRVPRLPNTSLGASQAGPSRLPEVSSTNVDLNLADEPSRNLLSTFSSMEFDTPVSIVEDTPAQRLRAIMNRMPTDTSTRADAPPASPSDRDSDFDPPNLASSTASSYKGSLKGLISRALRPPGDTPQKDNGRRRRNSIDTSEVDSSPRVQKVRQERAGVKGKRKSHSDEEVDGNTPTAIYDLFNERTPNISLDVHALTSSQATPPAATSTPQQQSLQSLNSYLHAHSNLLDQDSEMRRNLEGLESEEDGPPLLQFPGPKKTIDPKGTIRPRNSERSKSSPTQSTINASHHAIPDEHETISRHSARSPTLHRQSPTPHRPSRIPVSPSRTRHGSTTSISSISSRESHSDHETRTHEVNGSREQDLEHQWNKSRSRTLSKPTPNSTHVRPRTYSQSTDPRASPLPSHRRNRLSISSSRSSSSASSRDEEMELEAEVEAVVYHERERNWNSNHPTWHLQSLTHSRPSSPIPHSHSPSASPSPHSHTSYFDVKSHHLRPPSRIQSPHTSKSPSPRPHSIHGSTLSPSPSPSPSRLQRPRTTSFPARPTSPLPPITTTSPTSLRPRSGTPSGLKRTSTEPEISPRNGRLRATSSVSTIPTSSAKNSPRTGTPVSLTGSHSTKSSFSSALRNGRSRKSNENYEGETTDTDHEDVAQDNTPTLKPLAPLPVESPQEGRKTSPRHHSSIDEARLQKAVGSVYSPPASSPSPSSPPSTPPTPPTTLPLFESPATPPKISVSKSDFQTPSPPAGLPALPGPPSSSDEDTQKFGSQETATKTPRPPGGWAYTPARPNTLLRTNSLPTDDEGLSDHSASTPMNTTPLSRAQSLPAQTPAPPGGWLMTPAQKKSVRFDHEQESEASTGQDSELHLDSQAITDAEEPSVRKENGILKPSPLINTDVQVVGPSSPPASPSKSRRQARIRIVDEYGREDTSQDASPPRNKREDTPRRSSIRIVDAMGRVVEDSVIEPESVAESEVDESFVAPKSRTEGMARMQTGLTQLEQLFDTELDRTQSPIDVHRIQELEHVTSTSRKQRRKLKSDMDANLRAVRKSMNEVMSHMESRSSPQAQTKKSEHPKFSIGRWAAWITIGVLIQIVLLWVMYSMTLARAYELFLTTYYDPFSPELYMYEPRSAYATSAGGVLGQTASFFRKLWETLVEPSHAVLWGTS